MRRSSSSSTGQLMAPGRWSSANSDGERASMMASKRPIWSTRTGRWALMAPIVSGGILRAADAVPAARGDAGARPSAQPLQELRMTRRPLLSLLIAAALPLALLPVTARAAGDWPTTLEGIDLDPEKPGFEAFYDTRLGITWLTDVGAVQGTRFAWVDPGRGGVSTPLVEFDKAQRWLAKARFAEVGGWRLPSPAEFGSMFFQTLGHTDNVLRERGPFMNLGTYPAEDGDTGRCVWT